MMGGTEGAGGHAKARIATGVSVIFAGWLLAGRLAVSWPTQGRGRSCARQCGENVRGRSVENEAVVRMGPALTPKRHRVCDVTVTEASLEAG